MHVKNKSCSTGYHDFYGLLTVVSAVLFFIFLLLKPYYLRPSGSIGAADFCLAASGVVMAAACMTKLMMPPEKMQGQTLENSCSGSDLSIRTDKSRLSLGKLSGAFLYKQDICLYLFLIFVIAVNGVYAHIYSSAEYIKYSVYWVYNVFAVWTYRKLRDTDMRIEICGRKPDFEAVVCWVLELDIFIQLLIYISGKGRLFIEYWGAVRYMGSFNDPNQLAFFMFAAFLIIFSITSERGRKIKNNAACFVENEAAGRSGVCSGTIEYCSGTIGACSGTIKLCAVSVRTAVCVYPREITAVGAAVFIIVKSKSTGIMLGVLVFAVLLWCCSVFKLLKNGYISRKVLIAAAVLVLVCAAVLLRLIWPSADFNVQEMEYNTLTRIQEKLWKLSQNGFLGFFIDRGADKLMAFPQYMLYGAGEGGFDRFTLLNGEINELHSSPLSILFCYGCIPALLMLIWCIRGIQNKNAWQLCAEAALIAESLTLINYRQPMFWFLLF